MLDLNNWLKQALIGFARGSFEEDFSLRSINESKYSKQELLTEFNKTCTVCGNCHRKLHNGILKI